MIPFYWRTAFTVYRRIDAGCLIFNFQKKGNSMSKNKISFNVAEEKSARLAVLIDADNASAQTIAAILEETAKFGEAMAKRIYRELCRR